MRKFIVLSLLLLSACRTMAAHNYPTEWWAPVSREGAPGWEILPQDVQPPEVVLSKRNELGILSNFAATPFTYREIQYASVEGFWQMMKYPEGVNDERMKAKWPFTRAEVGQMTAFQAKDAGSKANQIMKQLGIDWVTFEGRKIKYMDPGKGDFYQLIWDAENAKLAQNPTVKDVLLKTGDLILVPDHKESPNLPPAWAYNKIWMEIRSQL